MCVQRQTQTLQANSSRSALWRNELGHVDRLRVLNAHRRIEHPQLELSNNLADNSMRPVAFGRKNWIPIGSAQAGHKVAAILSVVESCRRLKLPVRDYLATVLPGFADLQIRRLADLTPAVWLSRHS